MLAIKGMHLAKGRCVVESLIRHGTKIVTVGPIVTQVATMKATYGDKYPYSKPWPYESKKFKLLHEFFDSTSGRMNENSKVIVVEGNVAVGKSSFAKKLAEEFDLKVFMAETDDRCFNYNGYDIRNLDHLLSDGVKSYDLTRFLADPNLKAGLAGRLQQCWYEAKYMHYCKALEHLFNTGQGVVVVRSPFSDVAFVEAMRRMGWLTRNYNTFYNQIRKATLIELLRPHLTIYLDAPVSTIRERINARNDPREVKSQNLNDQYLTQIDLAYREKVLPEMRETGDVLEIDWTEVGDNMDMDMIAEEISIMQLESEDNEDIKFQEWSRLTEEDMCHLRRLYGDLYQMVHFFQSPIPYDCPEIIMTDEEAEEFDRKVLEHPAIRYEKGWAPEFGHNVLLKV